MKVTFHLRRLSEPAPAVALLLESPDVGRMLRLCARAGLDPLPRIHRVRGGLLLMLQKPSAAPFPGAVRLRCLAENLLLPADADLVPALLEDEAAGLVSRRGLVFLPGGHVLSFDPDRPLPLTALLDPGEVRRGDWKPLPERPPRADRLRDLVLDLPQDRPDTILEPGGEGIGTEEPRPADSSGPARVAGRAAVGLGRGLNWLGNALHLDGLARLGASLMASGLSLAPRLSEAMLGRQEAALRELLRWFREGKLEEALRRALPIGEPGRGAGASAGSQLPIHDTRYSLRNILNIGGPAGIWFGGLDVQAELMREYRKAAEEAFRRGDYRRAAFIYGKLLNDYRQAAAVLSRGGLHHDAAILYLEKLGDPLSAAGAFAAAGEIDRAVELYRQKGEHLLAADLLCRAGEEEAAIAEYTIAADLLVSRNEDYLGAGNLMLNRAGRADLAEQYYAVGWSLRFRVNSVPCARRLAWLFATQGKAAELLTLLAEAEKFFTPPGDEVAAGDFFNEVARLAERKEMAEVRDELRDRALLGIAVKLRQRAAVEERPGVIVSALLGPTSVWAPPVVRDADFAVQAAIRQRQKRHTAKVERGVTRLRLGEGTVTAVCHATETGDVFLGFASGEVVCFRPGSSESVSVPLEPVQVRGLATDATADFLAILRAPSPGINLLQGLRRREDRYWESERRAITGTGELWLSPSAVEADREHVVFLYDGLQVNMLAGALLTEFLQPDESPLAMALLHKSPYGRAGWISLLSFEANALVEKDLEGKELSSTRLGWTPAVRSGSSLACPPVAWLRPAPNSLELAGLTTDGFLFWSALEWVTFERHLVTRATYEAAPEGGYLAATLLRASFAAAVAESRIDWLQGGRRGLSVWKTTLLELRGAIACFPSPRTRELIIVIGDGQLVRVPVPA
jgi:tetratricopeptide (TPR) repeat protein